MTLLFKLFWTMSDRKIAIIPARGGSKRIPRKNIKDFLGKPIIAYAIELAKSSGQFDEIIVSTDDEEIADVGRKMDASVPFLRSKENSSDHATTMDVIKEVLTFYQNKGSNFSFACCIYPTSPLIQEKHLVQGYKKLRAEGFDSVVPIVPFSYPIWRGFEITEGGKVKMVWPEYLQKRSQDLKKVYHDAGQWYWFNTSKVADTLFTANTGYIILQEEEAQDIDEPSDWLLAEMKYNIINGG
jgi:pseudaminic acid cytidylyltransferase